MIKQQKDINSNPIPNRSFKTVTGVAVSQDNYQRSTKAETLLLEKLLLHLREHGIDGELGWQEFLPIPINYSRVSPVIIKQLSEIRIGEPCWLPRVPDLLFAKYGFVIEVDGNAHDKINLRAKRDCLREPEYSLLGLRCFRISNEQVYDSLARTRFIKDVITYIKTEHNHPDFKQRYQTRRTKISRARTAFKKLYPNGPCGEFKKAMPEESFRPFGVLKHQWGGYRIRISHVRKPKNILDLPVIEP